MLREINGLGNRTQNRHKFLLISSTKYEILLASWPLTVALIDEEDQSSALLVVLNVSSWSVGSTIPSATAVGLTAMVSIIIPGRTAVALPLLLISPLLVVVLVLLRGPGFSQSCVYWLQICCGCKP